MSNDTSFQETGGRQEYLSRRERRAQMRASGGGVSGGPRWFRKTLLWGGVAAVLVLVVWGMVKLSAGTPLPTDGGALADAVTERDHSSGPSDARVTLVEYSDFQCPACAAFAPVVKQALEDERLAGQVRFVYRSFPLTQIHPNATLAARAAQAASLQGKFWEMHDALFGGQKSWSRLSESGAREAFTAFAAQLGLDMTRFASDIDSGAVAEAVQWQSDSAERSGVNSTPSFFVNGTRMQQPQSPEQFTQFLIDALNANP